MGSRLPLSKPTTSDKVRHKSRLKLGPMTNDGITVTRLMLFASANSHAAFSAKVFARAYHNFAVSKKVNISIRDGNSNKINI